MSNWNWRNGFASGLIVGGIIVLVSMVYIVGLNYCPGQPCNYTAYTERDPQGDRGNRIWDIPNPVRPTFSYEVEPPYAESNPTRQEYYDLRAQERMAHATDWIAWLTLVTGIVGLFGFGALVVTLGLQRAANRIADKSGRLQTRAYVSDKEILPVYEFDESGKASGVLFRVFYGNSGNSPAFVDYAGCKLVYADKETGRFSVEFEPTGFWQKSVIPSGETKFSDTPIFKYGTIRDGGIYALLGIIVYRDVFDDRHIVEFGVLPDDVESANITKENIGDSQFRWRYISNYDIESPYHQAK